ncbi:MAG: DUF2945 domain-containing protein [Candidatus Acidiferrum sp.]
MSKAFKRGDHVEWNSEAGRVRGVIVMKVISDVWFRNRVHGASRAEPRYFIEDDETHSIAILKGEGLRLIDTGQDKPTKEKDAKTWAAIVVRGATYPASGRSVWLRLRTDTRMGRDRTPFR